MDRGASVGRRRVTARAKVEAFIDLAKTAPAAVLSLAVPSANYRRGSMVTDGPVVASRHGHGQPTPQPRLLRDREQTSVVDLRYEVRAITPDGCSTLGELLVQAYDT